MAPGSRTYSVRGDHRAQADRRHPLGECQQHASGPSAPPGAASADRASQYQDRGSGRQGDPLPPGAASPMIADAGVLNEQQRIAVAHAGGPLLIVAGAGTGKTRVLVERYRRLRQEGVPAERILLLTFTEKAAREVLDRVEQEDYLPAGERFILTYHAFAQRFLQEDGWLCGIPRAFRLISEVRKWELMRDVLLAQRPAHLFHAQRPFERIGELLKLVERAKQELITPAEFRAWAKARAGGDDPVVGAQREAAAVYTEYQQRMLAEDRLDFDDTIYFSVQLLVAQPSVAIRQSQRFAQVMVDEFQDTNFAQSRLLELLAGADR